MHAGALRQAGAENEIIDLRVKGINQSLLLYGRFSCFLRGGQGGDIGGGGKRKKKKKKKFILFYFFLPFLSSPHPFSPNYKRAAGQGVHPLNLSI